MIWSRLQEMYAARWRKLTEADGWNEWANATADLDEDIMLKALDSIVEHHQRLSEGGAKDVYPPRLPEVLGAYRRVDASSKPYIPPKVTCAKCHGSGWGYGLKTKKGWYLDPKYPKKTDGNLYMTLIPCACHNADQGYSQTLRDRLRRYIVMPSNGPLSDLRDLQGQYETPELVEPEAAR